MDDYQGPLLVPPNDGPVSADGRRLAVRRVCRRHWCRRQRDSVRREVI